MDIGEQLRSFLAVMVQLSLFVSAPRVSFAQSGSGSTASHRSEVAEQAASTAIQSAILYCPLQEKGPVPRSESEAGQVQTSETGGPHKVTLSWKASVASPTRSAAIGYCLYRSKQVGGTKQNPIFGEAERINLVSLPNTTCIDESVQNGATYRYIVTAVNWSLDPSLPSNEAFATIPSDQPPNATSVSASGPISCREQSVQRRGQVTPHD